jgi:PAS domain S-box-containing protein
MPAKHSSPPILAEGLQSLGEDAWIEVIQKMDEVYNDLLQYEVALEEKNAALEESQQFVFSVLASMSDILVVCDRDGRIEVVNQALVAFSGKPESELIGMPLFDLFADDGARANAERMFANHGMKGLADCELPLKGADGAAVPVSLNCTPRFNHQGTQVGMVITGRPVGELRRAYQALREAHEDLKRTQQQLLHSEKMASLGRLVAGVAHELNNPISFVLGNAHALHRYAQRLEQYLAAFHAGRPREELEALRRELRIDRLLEDLPPLIEGTVEGAEHDVYTTKNNTYLITELCSSDMNKVIKNKLTETEACFYMAQLMEGYREIYDHQIVHRDLKPANLLITDSKILKIADFGFGIKSKELAKPSKYNVGSPLYMAPESLKKNEYSYKTDLWSIGIIFFEMLTGDTPWRAKTEK